MLARDVTVEDFDTEDWIRIGRILRGKVDREPSVAAERGGVLLVTDGTRVIKLLHTVRGRMDPASVAPNASLREIAHATDAAWAMRLFPGALRLLSTRFALRLERADDFVGQLAKLVAVARELEAEGAVELFPTGFGTWPVPTQRTIKLFCDAICPVGKSVLFAALDGADLTTCITLHRGRDGFDRVVGPERVRRETGLRSDDFRRNYRGIARAVELTVGPLALGGFAEQKTWSRILRDRTPGAWAAAVASREVIFYPLAPALAIPLGIDVGRVAWALARDLADRLGVGTWGRA
jgi:hypothetical protein